MTDNEIIKALGQCETQKTCSDCPYFEKIGCKKHLYQDAYTLINRQKAEIEKIKKKLKYYLNTNEENGVVYIPKFVVDNLVKEMVGGEK